MFCMCGAGGERLSDGAALPSTLASLRSFASYIDRPTLHCSNTSFSDFNATTSLFKYNFYFLIMYPMTGILLACLVGLVASQRPSYVPNPVRYPDVAPRFRVATSTEEVVALGNRNGGVTTTTERLPVDARGNVDVVNQIKSWPEDKRPFWYVNAQHIENARNRPFPAAGQEGDQVQQVNVPSRSSFLS